MVFIILRGGGERSISFQPPRTTFTSLYPAESMFAASRMLEFQSSPVAVRDQGCLAGMSSRIAAPRQILEGPTHCAADMARPNRTPGGRRMNTTSPRSARLCFGAGDAFGAQALND